MLNGPEQLYVYCILDEDYFVLCHVNIDLYSKAGALTANVLTHCFSTCVYYMSDYLQTLTSLLYF